MSSPSISISVPPALYIPAIHLSQSRHCTDEFGVHSELQGKEVHGTGDRCEVSALG